MCRYPDELVCNPSCEQQTGLREGSMIVSRWLVDVQVSVRGGDILTRGRS